MARIQSRPPFPANSDGSSSAIANAWNPCHASGSRKHWKRLMPFVEFYLVNNPVNYVYNIVEVLKAAKLGCLVVCDSMKELGQINSGLWDPSIDYFVGHDLVPTPHPWFKRPYIWIRNDLSTPLEKAELVVNLADMTYDHPSIRRVIDVHTGEDEAMDAMDRRNQWYASKGAEMTYNNLLGKY